MPHHSFVRIRFRNLSTYIQEVCCEEKRTYSNFVIWHRSKIFRPMRHSISLSPVQSLSTDSTIFGLTRSPYVKSIKSYCSILIRCEIRKSNLSKSKVQKLFSSVVVCIFFFVFSFAASFWIRGLTHDQNLIRAEKCEMAELWNSGQMKAQRHIPMSDWSIFLHLRLIKWLINSRIEEF